MRLPRTKPQAHLRALAAITLRSPTLAGSGSEGGMKGGIGKRGTALKGAHHNHADNDQDQADDAVDRRQAALGIAPAQRFNDLAAND